MSNSINIGIAGLGTIGCGVVNNLLRNKESLKEKYGLDFEIIGVSASNKNKKRSINLEDFNWYDDPIDLAKDNNIDAFVQAQVHDQLIINVSEDQAEEFAPIVQKIMETTTQLPGITLKAPPEIANNWKDGH